MNDNDVIKWLIGTFIVVFVIAFWLHTQPATGGRVCGQYDVANCSE